jgi:hypothetical protein
MPQPVSASRLRKPHARALAALSLFSAHLVGLNDAASRPDAAISAACALAEELRAWIALARWKQATTAARASWPMPITEIMRQSTSPKSAQDGNTLPSLIDVRAAAAGHAQAGRDPRLGLAEIRRRSRATARQDQLDLVAAVAIGAEVVPIGAAAVAAIAPAAEAVASAAPATRKRRVA